MTTRIPPPVTRIPPPAARGPSSRGRAAGGGGLGGGVNPFDFGKSKATEFDATKGTGVNFDDVAGIEEAKEELSEIVGGAAAVS